MVRAETPNFHANLGSISYSFIRNPIVSRIAIATIGSFGDLHPKIAIAIELRQRGHDIIFVVQPEYQPKIEALGFEFYPLRPTNDALSNPAEMARLMDLKTGSEYLIRDWLMPSLRDSYEDLLAGAKNADLIIAGGVVYAAALVAETLKIPWVSTVLQPIAFFSAHDPSVIPIAPFLIKLRRLGPGVNGTIIRLLRGLVTTWAAPLRQLRQDLNLSPQDGNPLMGGNHSPHLVLAMFSPSLGSPQPDWPTQTVQTGATFFDDNQSGLALSPELSQFLAAGEPPIVFTLGSAAVVTPGRFYQDSIQAAQLLDRRAILLIGSNERPDNLTDRIIAIDYVPYSLLFPNACAIVHQGGIGTTTQALRSGRPTIIMPYSHDQPDNAARVERLGTSRTIPRDRYSADCVAAELKILLTNPSYANTAANLGPIIQQEDGAFLACDAIETILNH
jgi:rhamnosyltransferase subunit B